MRNQKRSASHRSLQGQRRRARILAFEQLDVRAVLSATVGHAAYGGMSEFDQPLRIDGGMDRDFGLRGGFDTRGSGGEPWLAAQANPDGNWNSISYVQAPTAYFVDAGAGQTIVIVVAGGPIVAPLWISIPTMSYAPPQSSPAPPAGGRDSGSAPLSIASALGGGRPSGAAGETSGGVTANSFVQHENSPPTAPLLSLGTSSVAMLNAAQTGIVNQFAASDTRDSTSDPRIDSAPDASRADSRADHDLVDPNGGLIELDTSRDLGSIVPGEALRGDALRPRKGLRLEAPGQVDRFWDEVFEMLAEDNEAASEVAKALKRAPQPLASQPAAALYDDGGTIELAAGAEHSPATDRGALPIGPGHADVEITMDAGVALYQAFEMLGVPAEGATIEAAPPPAVDVPPAQDSKAEAAPVEESPYRAASVGLGVLAALPFAIRRKRITDEPTRWWRRRRTDRS